MDIWNTCRILLSESDISFTDTHQQALQRYADLLRTWNRFVSLVSWGDLEHLEDIHIPDALSLAPFIKSTLPTDGHLLDIGSGGGFPAIPLKILFPDLPFTLIERSVKKIGFLRKIVGALQLQNIQLIHGEFPKAVPDIPLPTIITARAVEQPIQTLHAITDYMAAFPTQQTTFLCQSGDPTAHLAPAFTIEALTDAWTDASLRRGSLYRVQCST